ncbi:MAG TPA: HTH domain-containing protein, partial [Solibacillus sp.]
MTKVYTVYNQVVQQYIMDHAVKPTAKKVNERLDILQASVHEQCGIFAKLFPGKRNQVLNEIAYATGGCGIWKIGAATLARKADCSERTVYAAVNALKKTGEFIVARLADGHAGHYVFVDKRSERFEDIMSEVFGLPMSEIATLNAGLVAGLENAKTVDTTSVEGEKQRPNYINSFKNKLLNVLDIDIKLSTTQDARVSYMTDLQKSLYEAIKPLVKDQQLDDVQKAVLAMPITNAREFVKAKNAIVNTLSDTMNKTLKVATSLRAVASGAYQKSLARPAVKKYVETVCN